MSQSPAQLAALLPRDSISLKVVGLGAPISVRIRLQPGEIRIIRPQLLARIAERDREDSDHDLSEQDPSGRVHRDALDAMLRELDANADASAGVEVLWPTSLAHDILHAALDEALARLPRASVDRSLPAIGQALDTACACLETWMAFTTVDRDGLQDVWL
jgi:hypothetical protein